MKGGTDKCADQAVLEMMIFFFKIAFYYFF